MDLNLSHLLACDPEQVSEPLCTSIYVFMEGR